MDDQRLHDIYHCVVHEGFYTVGPEKFKASDITHEEMVELVLLACRGKGFEDVDPVAET